MTSNIFFIAFFHSITHQDVSLPPSGLRFSPLHLWPTHKLNGDGPYVLLFSMEGNIQLLMMLFETPLFPL